jgi:hypothetical protein
MGKARQRRAAVRAALLVRGRVGAQLLLLLLVRLRVVLLVLRGRLLLLLLLLLVVVVVMGALVPGVRSLVVRPLERGSRCRG